MRDFLHEVLILQSKYSADNTPEMARRGRLIRHEIPQRLRALVTERISLRGGGVNDLKVGGRDGTGKKTFIPWVRVHSESRSPSATVGWYVVYLFSASGDRVYLSLNQGTTKWTNGAFVPRPEPELRSRVRWARQVLADRLVDGFVSTEAISLGVDKGLGRAYEVGNVAAVAYDRDELPDEGVLADDLAFLVDLLQELYAEADRSLAIPGEPAAEIADALTAADESAGRRNRSFGYRLTAAERRAIEQHAVSVTTDYLVSQGFKVSDVGATHSFDLDARRAGERVFVEVKGTTSNGAEIVLTKAEVELHLEKYPKNMLAVVTDIALDRKAEPPTATAGVLRVTHPWQVDSTLLTPLTFRYAVPDLLSSGG
ncbi:MrcB family domain-containing protein [Actinokineospora iranica]|nr:DUF3578 domain-containing protein [Actinokineospora iranica]